MSSGGIVVTILD